MFRGAIVFASGMTVGTAIGLVAGGIAGACLVLYLENESEGSTLTITYDGPTRKPTDDVPGTAEEVKQDTQDTEVPAVPDPDKQTEGE